MNTARTSTTTALQRLRLFTKTSLVAALFCFVLLWVISLTSCVLPATQVQITVDTDIPVQVAAALRVTVRWTENSAPMVREYRWDRAGAPRLQAVIDASLDGSRMPDGAVLMDAGGNSTLGEAQFPASFTVVPSMERNDRPFDAVIELLLDRGITVRRTIQRTLRSGTQHVAVFLSARCVDPAVGCRSQPCLRQTLCEERGQTCGEEGECVAFTTLTRSEVPVGWDAHRPVPGCGHMGEACCLWGSACNSQLTCSEGICRGCTPSNDGCCSAAGPQPDGTICGAAPATCFNPSTCRAGVCTQGELAMNGTTCSMGGPCLMPGVCNEGSCSPPMPSPDGTVCAPSNDPCKQDGVCMSGTCSPPQPRADGTICDRTNDPCKQDGVCMAGSCTSRRNFADGTICARPGNSCQIDGVCSNGVCSGPRTAADGTVCAPAANSCQTNGVCTAGVCSPVGRIADGMPCGMATDACQVNGTCRGGECTGTTARPDGTVCAMAMNSCQTNGTCSGGRCSGVGNVANGTQCAPSANPCQIASVCTNGTCPPLQNAPNGTECAPTGNPCQTAGTCSNGTCGPITNRPDGTVCGAATACLNAPTCRAGTCTPNPRPNNTRPSATTQCCNGVELGRNDINNCGVCGLHCPGGGTCQSRATSGTQYFCTCNGAAQCPGNFRCRMGEPNLNNICACLANNACPGSLTCRMIVNAPDYCTP